MALFFYLLVLVAYKAFTVPAAPSRFQMSFDSRFTRQNVSTVSVAPSLFLISDLSWSFAKTTSQLAQRPETVQATSLLSFNFSSVSPSSPLSASFNSTNFVTKIATVFETTTVVPSSTNVVTVVVTATATVTASPLWGNRTLWAAPPQMTDLSAFNITYFPSGRRNLRIAAQIPAQDIAPSAKSLQTTLLPSSNANTAPTILQLVYPAHSVNPGSKPEGGADFYASPLNLTGARNVTLEYSVFFPAGFNWVKGGKLPGLYGGHTGCSGGASARDCFSTRLMWRPQGIGELYLYAPKDKQTASLCSDTGSVCDTSYGFSIGRGAFNFTAGDWTRLQQTVVLNTPGQNDGIFMLFVDGLLAINRSDIFYRDDVRLGRSALGSDSVSSAVEFVGLFFSTFFGGHGKEYATPKQQYIWFKDFMITRHL